MTDALHT